MLKTFDDYFLNNLFAKVFNQNVEDISTFEHPFPIP